MLGWIAEVETAVGEKFIVFEKFSFLGIHKKMRNSSSKSLKY